MTTKPLYWDEFADATIRKLVRPEPGDPLLIVADTSNDLVLAEACLAAAIRSGADAQLLIKPRHPVGSASEPGPILSNAILSSKLILALAHGVVRTPATVEARSKGTRLLSTNVEGIEDYVVRALLDVDFDAMVRNADLIAKLWEDTKLCRVTSPQGTDITFEHTGRPSIVGDGALSEDGEVDFFPGAQVSIAPVEETINGVIVIDASDSVQGVVHNPYSFTLENGVVTEIDGGKEAAVMRNWLETRGDSVIYNLCHFSIGLNKQAGISGNMIEDERMLAAVDFGFGYQDPKFGGTIGYSPYHMDIMLATPTIFLDGKEMSGGGKLNPDFGFEEM
ncbi:MAG: aminopeptidase [Trueperaceae bacterium]|nr:MAG: aminopeptidase [Trueperaceae bacterium]